MRDQNPKTRFRNYMLIGLAGVIAVFVALKIYNGL